MSTDLLSQSFLPRSTSTVSQGFMMPFTFSRPSNDPTSWCVGVASPAAGSPGGVCSSMPPAPSSTGETRLPSSDDPGVAA
eukprot:CAMPEP_0171645670 /NCGR_PEP_ID=MMETSP0990-20121206/34223_1 /TAXON_ID=483369 /ORGANISM="non described non described, Strain CCMP2098" /LENGTH=79 /DNA_ID=CAMNT_0012222195 /DNA_START=22 /DNA_END=257 /DNA_ORIENTATION=+